MPRNTEIVDVKTLKLLASKDLGRGEIVDYNDQGFVEMLHGFKVHD